MSCGYVTESQPCRIKPQDRVHAHGGIVYQGSLTIASEVDHHALLTVAGGSQPPPADGSAFFLDALQKVKNPIRMPPLNDVIF